MSSRARCRSEFQVLHNRFDFTFNKTKIAPLSQNQSNHASVEVGIEELKLTECAVTGKKKSVRKATKSVMLVTEKKHESKVFRRG